MPIVLRSRTEQLRFLGAIQHRALAAPPSAPRLLATLLSYAVARTITRPLGAITGAHARDGRDRRPHRARSPPRARRLGRRGRALLATTFNTLTDSIARFQREAAQRERLSSLGRLSTVIAHEVRNPLMIIKAALRTLARDGAHRRRRAATRRRDIDEEVVRLNRIVNDVLDFARPIRFELGAGRHQPRLPRRRRRRASAPTPAGRSALDLDRRRCPTLVTDAERLRAGAGQPARQRPPGRRRHRARRRRASLARSTVAPRGRPGRVVDHRPRHAARASPTDDLPRIFDPYFTTRRGGTGLGLPIARNIVEGLGGTITRRPAPPGRRHRDPDRRSATRRCGPTRTDRL